MAKSYSSYQEAKEAAMKNGIYDYIIGRSSHSDRYYVYPNNRESTKLKDGYHSKEYVIIAKQLGYSDEVIMKLKHASNDTEAGNIMASARRGYY